MSVKHFECRQWGRPCGYYGKDTSNQYVGGCIFVDHASSYVLVGHQFGFSAVEKTRAKHTYESMCMDNGIFVQDYLTYSGTFKVNSFVRHIHETRQVLKFC
jgi:hypothetical protein